MVKNDVPCNIRGIKDTQAYGILMVGNIDGLLETQDFRVAHVRAVDE
jgi:hypothetical protein